MPLRNRLLCTAVIALLLASLWSYQTQATEPGNVPPAKTAQPPILNEKDFFPYKQKGRGTLAGQAFLSSPSGKAITQAGAPVHLIPITPYTRYWFDHNVRTTSCSTTEPPASPESASSSTLSNRLPARGADSAPDGKAVDPLSPHNQSQPDRTFLVHQNSRRALLHRQSDRRRIGSPQRRTAAGLAWLAIELDADEKLTNLVVTDCKASLC